MKLWDIFVLKKILQMLLIGVFTWHMQRTRESRQSRLKTRPGWSPGSRHEDRIEPIWSLFEACSGTSWIDCRKKAGSLEENYFYFFKRFLRVDRITNWMKKSFRSVNIAAKIECRAHLISPFNFTARNEAQNLISDYLKLEVHLFSSSESNRD